ncbi:MAG: DotH/IcmK family type IV secretion protein, partial [Gammaproteobacteria bacterium]
MDKALTKKIGISILLALLSGLQISWADVPPPIPAASPAADMAQFQSWLKNNGQASGGQPTIPPPPVMSSSTPSSLTTVETITTVTKRKRPTRPMPLTYSQSQQAMLNSVPNTSPPNPDADAAFDSMMQQNIPLTPQQIVRLRQKIDESQRAAAIPATVPPKPVSSTLMVNLAPGATPPAIRLAQGYVTSLVFVDSTGSPWPIASYDIGDPKTTNIQWDGKSNVLLVQASSPYGDSDLVIRLMGLPTPITLELVLGQRVVDYRTDIHVAGIGPNAKDLPTGTGLPNSANQVLLNVLDGVAPPGSRQLTVRGGDCLAWLLGDTMFLRTRLTVLSPGWVGRMVSP